MAASVEGAFVIIDRATGPMRKMELQALATDAAINKVGKDLDAKVGSPKQLRQIENLGRETRTLERDVNNLSGTGGGGRGGGIRSLGRNSDDAGRKLEKLLLRLVKFRLLFKVTMFSAIAVAIGVVVQALGALAGGATAMVPAVVGAVGALGSLLGPLVSLAGVFAGMPALLVGFVGATKVLKLATSDLQQAFNGNAQALKRLTPEARKFLNLVNKEYRPMLNRLKVTAQEGLFPGLVTSLEQLRVAFPYVNALVAEFSKRLGTLAKQASSRLSQGGFLRDFLSIGRQGGRVFSGLGTAALNIVDALRHIAVAAEPFTDWLTRTAVRWSKFIDDWARAGRESGRFGAFFARVQRRLVVFFDIVKNLWNVMLGLASAARPVGDAMFRSFDRATKRWADFVNSIEGQGRIRAWFQRAERSFNLIWDIVKQLARALVLLGRAGGASGNTLWRAADKALRRWNDWAETTRGQLTLVKAFQQYVPAVRAIGSLFADLGVAILRMGRDPALAGMTANLAKLIPMLETFLNQIVRQLGPPLINLLLQAGQMLETLTQAGGPLQIFLELLGRILALLNKVIGSIPGLGIVLATAFSVIMVQRFISWIGRATVAMLGLRNAAGEAAIATNAAMGGGALGAGRRGVGAAAGAVEGGLGLALAARLGGNTRLGYKLFGAGVGARTAAGGLLARAGNTRLGYGALGAGLRLGRVAGPLGIGAALAGLGVGMLPQSVLPGNVTTGRKIQSVGGSVATGAALGATAGLIGGPLAPISSSVGALIGATGGLGYGLAKNVFHPLGFGAAPANDPFAQVQARLGRMGGDDPNRRQLSNQVRYLSRAQKQYAQDTSDSGRIVRAEIMQEFRARRQVLNTMNQQLRAERQIRNERERMRDISRARTYGRALGVGFDVDAKKLGTPGAIDSLISRFKKLAQTLGPAGRMALSKPLADWASDMRKKGKFPKAEVEKINAAIVASFADVDKKVKVVNGRILTGTTAQWKGIKNALITQANLASAGLKNSFSSIMQQATGALTVMGYSGAEIQNILKGAAGGKVGAMPTYGGAASGFAAAGVPTYVPGQGFTTPGTNLTHARGGRIGGVGLMDTVPVGGRGMAAPGELIVNRHTEGRVNRMLAGAGTSLGLEVARENRPHSAEMYATGGRGSGASSVVPAVSRLIRVLTARFPLSVTSTTGGEHANQSYHYRGEAVDLAGSPGAMSGASAWIKQSGLYRSLLEGIHNPNLSVKFGKTVPPSFWGASTWAGHADHIHLAAAALGGARGALAGGAAGAAPQLRLAAPVVGARGVPGALAQAGANAFSAGLQRSVNRRIRRAGTGGPLPGGGSNATNMALAHQMMLGSWGEGQWPALQALWQAESGFSSTATNPSSGAFGIPQALPASKMGAAAVAGNAGAQIAWGLRYIAGRYGSPAAAYSAWQSRSPHWYAQGGRTAPDFGGWFRDGGTATYRRPTMIGVGDRPGGETVSVTPAGADGKRVTFSPTVHIDRIDYRGTGDIEEVVHREVGAAFERFASDLSQAGIEVD